MEGITWSNFEVSPYNINSLWEIDNTNDGMILVRLIESTECKVPFINENTEFDKDFLNWMHSKVSAESIIGNKFIPILALLSNPGDIRLFGQFDLLELTEIRIVNSLFEYKFENGKIYPDLRLMTNAFTKLFLFDSNEKFDKFLFLINLKFNSTKFSESQIKRIKNLLKDSK